MHLFYPPKSALTKGAQALCITLTILSAMYANALLAEQENSWRATAPHIQVELLSGPLRETSDNANASALQMDVAINFLPDDHWHVYWLNPGDTGLAPKVRWNLPEGASASEFNWGFPSYIPIEHLVNIGYEDQLFLPATITFEEKPENPAVLSAEVSWLVCKEACIPGSATLKRSLVQDASAPSSAPTAFASLTRAWQARIPQPMALLGAQVQLENGHIEFQLYSKHAIFSQVKNISVFVEETDLVKYSKPVTKKWNNNWLLWRQALSEYFSRLPSHVNLVIVLDEQRAYKVRVPFEA